MDEANVAYSANTAYGETVYGRVAFVPVVLAHPEAFYQPIYFVVLAQVGQVINCLPLYRTIASAPATADMADDASSTPPAATPPSCPWTDCCAQTSSTTTRMGKTIG